MKDKKHSNGFNTPKNYFEDFEDRLYSKLSEGNLPKETGYTIPKGYFDQLDSVILKNAETSVNQSKVIPLFSRRTIAYAITIAACAMLVFSLVNTNPTLVTIETLDISSIESYIEEGYLNIDSYEIAYLLQEEDLINLNAESEYISEDIIEYYLLEQIDDSSILIE